MSEQENQKQQSLSKSNGGGAASSPSPQPSPPGAVVAKRFFLFQNLETQGANLTFSRHGQLYTYEDGQVYEMNPEQAAHLNSLAVTLHTSEVTPEGQIQSKPVSRRKRFSVTEVTAAEVDRLRQEMAVNQ